MPLLRALALALPLALALTLPLPRWDAGASMHARSPELLPSVYLPYISPICPLYFPYISPISPLYLA